MADRHKLEREALDRRHAREKLDIARDKRTLSRLETREKDSLEKAVRRAARQARKTEVKAGQDFHEAARDQGLCKNKEFKDGELQEDFNDAAEFAEGADRAGDDDDDDDRAPSWRQRAEDLSQERGRGQRQNRDRGRGMGFRRDDD